MIGSSKHNRKNYPRKCFWTQERETWVKFNPRLSANQPSNNWALSFSFYQKSIKIMVANPLGGGHSLIWPIQVCANQWGIVFRVLSLTQGTQIHHLAWENSWHFLTPPRFPVKWRLGNESRNTILMACHYPNLGSASEWSYRVGNLIQPIRSTLPSSAPPPRAANPQITTLWVSLVFEIS